MGIASFTGRIGNLIAPFTSLMVVASHYRDIVDLIASDAQITNHTHQFSVS